MSTSRPNVVLILADDLGYGDLSCFGNNDLKTPHIDRLSSGGLRLTQHYTASPLCGPARGALLSGCCNHRVGALSVESCRGLDRITLNAHTIADYFKAGGYRTGMVGKWHSGLFDMRYHPNSRGFEEFAGFLNGGMDYYKWCMDYNGSPHRSDGRYLTDVFTDEAIAFTERHLTEPFFLHLAYNTPHSPLQAPEEDVRPYKESAKFNDGVATLYGMIQRMDTGIGRLVEALEKNGQLENTIILFTSDNGPWLGGDETGHQMARYNGPFRGMKQDVLEGGIRVPAILHWPGGGLAGGRDVNEMIHFCDWMPTFLNACDVSFDQSDGHDMIETLRGNPQKNPPKRFWQFNRYEPVLCCNSAMRDHEWKVYWPRIPEAMVKLKEDSEWYRHLMTEPHPMMELTKPHFIERELSEPGKPELYNIVDDPAEEDNLADKHPERLSRMLNELENWFDRVEAERRALPEYAGE